MFNNLRIKNFRSIKDSKNLKLSNLNIIIGPNNAGKSSILYSILLLKQTLNDKDPNAALVTSGPYLDLGSYLDLINANNPEKSLEINFELNKSFSQRIQNISRNWHLDNLMKKCNKFQIKFKFDKKKNNIFVSTFNISNSKSRESYAGKYINEKWVLNGFPKEILPYMEIYLEHFLPRFHSFGKKPKSELIVNKVLGLYYSGIAISTVFRGLFERILYVGPIRQMIPKYGFLGTQSYSELSPSGQNLMKIISTIKFYGITKKSILTELNYWLDKKFHVIKNIRILNIDSDKTIISIYGDDWHGDKNINLALMGSGLSQIVPVIVQTIITPKNGCVIIEQPEIHLHPAAQATLGDLFVRYAKNNKQIIVETHSEHLLLRVRRRVAEGKISPDLVSIFFVDKSKNETRIRKLNLQKNGHFKSWPANFFEEGYREAMAIAMAQTKDKSK